MTSVLLGVAGVLVLNVLVAGWRVAVAEGTRDRLSGLLLLGTVGAGVLVTLASAFDEPALRDTALVVVALAVLVVVVRLTGESERERGRGRRG